MGQGNREEEEAGDLELRAKKLLTFDARKTDLAEAENLPVKP